MKCDEVVSGAEIAWARMHLNWMSRSEGVNCWQRIGCIESSLQFFLSLRELDEGLYRIDDADGSVFRGLDDDCWFRDILQCVVRIIGREPLWCGSRACDDVKKVTQLLDSWFLAKVG